MRYYRRYFTGSASGSNPLPSFFNKNCGKGVDMLLNIAYKYSISLASYLDAYVLGNLINIMKSNTSGTADERGKHRKWVEGNGIQSGLNHCMGSCFSVILFES
jgi:hypothetical protein